MNSTFFSNLIILSISISAVFTYNCDVYRCASTNDYYVHPNTCVLFHKNELANIKYYEIDLTHCNSRQYCPNQLAGNEYSLGCYDKPPDDDRKEPTKGIDKDKCQRDIDCKSGNCAANKLCEGKDTAKPCLSHNECKIGFYCKMVTVDSGQCQPQEGEGNACASDLDCLNNMGCLGESGKKICVKYYSLKDNTKVYAPEDKRFCLSNFERDNFCVSTKLISDEECIGSQTDCEYTYVSPSLPDPVKFIQKCQCSPARYDKMYCPMSTENPKWKEMVPAYNSYYNGDVLKRHTILRNFFTNEIRLKQFEIEKYPKFKDADKCYKDFMMGGFYQSLKLGLFVILSLAIFLL